MLIIKLNKLQQLPENMSHIACRNLEDFEEWNRDQQSNKIEHSWHSQFGKLGNPIESKD